MIRYRYLDILRAVAILLVIGCHLPAWWFENNSFLFAFVNKLNNGGWTGVDLFFVLSGFLVSGLLFKEYQKTKQLSIKRFLIRRGFKIFPPFIVLTVFTVIMKLNAHAFSFQKLFADLTFTQNYFSGFWEHTWSLAVEEHFYWILAALFFLCTRHSKGNGNPFRFLFVLTPAVILFCLFLRIANFNPHPAHFTEYLTPTHLRIDSLFIGVFLSYLVHFHLSVINSFQRFLVPLSFLSLSVYLAAFNYPREGEFFPIWTSVGFTALSLSACVLLLQLCRIEKKTGLLKNPLAQFFGGIGKYSYSIYLWHLPVEHYQKALFVKVLGSEPSHWMLFFGYLFGSLGLGIVMAKLVEVPSLKLRDTLFPVMPFTKESSLSESVSKLRRFIFWDRPLFFDRQHTCRIDSRKEKS